MELQQMTDKSVHVFLSGRVQGVWFRGWMAQEAASRGLKGWVRNLNDGRVEAVLAGPEEQVDDMLGACREGPPAARVDDVEVAASDPPAIERFEQRPNG
jgi:acylphosphatase